MGLFKAYDADAKAKQPETATPKSPSASAGSVNASNESGSLKNPAKKSIPTPTRRQAEEARRQRLQPVLSKKEARLKEREARNRARDESMERVHARPYNALIRDWVDHRLNLAEFMMPLMLLVLVVALVGSTWLPAVMLVSMYAIWALVILLVLDTGWMWFGCRKQLKAHFPDQPLKGKMSYAISRAMLMRRSRQPAPRVKRFAKFAWPHQSDIG